MIGISAFLKAWPPDHQLLGQPLGAGRPDVVVAQHLQQRRARHPHDLGRDHRPQHDRRQDHLLQVRRPGRSSARRSRPAATQLNQSESARISIAACQKIGTERLNRLTTRTTWSSAVFSRIAESVPSGMPTSSETTSASSAELGGDGQPVEDHLADRQPGPPALAEVAPQQAARPSSSTARRAAGPGRRRRASPPWSTRRPAPRSRSSGRRPCPGIRRIIRNTRIVTPISVGTSESDPLEHVGPHAAMVHQPSVAGQMAACPKIGPAGLTPGRLTPRGRRPIVPLAQRRTEGSDVAGRLLAGAARATINPPLGIRTMGFSSRVGFVESVAERSDRHHPGARQRPDDARHRGARHLPAADRAGRRAAAGGSARRSARRPPTCWSTSATPTARRPSRTGSRSRRTRRRSRSSTGSTCWSGRSSRRPRRGRRSSRRGWRPAGARAGSAINRREVGPDGLVFLGEVPDGETDPAVGVIRVDDLDGQPIATLCSLGCHTVVVGPRDQAASPDFPAPARRVIESTLGGLALFLQACGGDVMPVGGMGYETDCSDANERDRDDARRRGGEGRGRPADPPAARRADGARLGLVDLALAVGARRG